MLCRARAGRRAADTRLMARALTWIVKKSKWPRRRLALADVILPDETDEIFANEAGRMSCACSTQPIPRPGKKISAIWASPPGRLSAPELDRFAERIFSDRP